ncbi:DNA methyltransferase [Olivibacter sp. 47]|uniref:DNA methyltransferase n=1 Tax=Olivibacter sp. 47 TaxID=3056486 RepID=UPI0025A3F57D|nr:DNA methyltransferase [Olivibacter sp. 47]MDM8174764.1 DNA methyltransferase [Olivibacter sp. 47]
MSNIKLIHGDCMDVMREYPDKYFDLAVVDPPYGINAPKQSMGSNKSRKGDGYPGISVAEKLRKGRLNQGSGKLKNRALNMMNCDWDIEIPSLEYFAELMRVSRNQIIWGGNYFPLPPTRGILCWDKMQPWDNFSQFELAWTSFDKPAAMFRYSNTGGANAETKIHPTQKPVKLYYWTFKKFANAGFKILDTHLGSGSSAIAAHEFGVEEFVGVEIDKSYYGDSVNRFKQATAQVSIFDVIREVS